MRSLPFIKVGQDYRYQEPRLIYLLVTERPSIDTLVCVGMKLAHELIGGILLRIMQVLPPVAPQLEIPDQLLLLCKVCVRARTLISFKY